MMESGPNVLYSKLTAFEKTNYKFKNWRHACAGSVVFSGCSFPSFYPRTFRALGRALDGIDGVSLAVDCCGLPLFDLKSPEAARCEKKRVEASLSARGAREVVPLCPNCASAFEDDFGFPQMSVYAKLRELVARGAMASMRVTVPGVVFVPCPDREKRTWLSDAAFFLSDRVRIMDCSACCGAAFEFSRPDASDAAAVHVLETAVRECSAAGFAEPVLYVYCASCAGRLERARREHEAEAVGSVRIVHMLSALLGTPEAPAVKTTVLNRALAALR